MYQVNIFICLFLFDLFCSSIYKYLREGDNKGWDDWMASPTRWTWIWVNSASWWWTGRPGVLQFMGSQRVRHDWATELTDWSFCWKGWMKIYGKTYYDILISLGFSVFFSQCLISPIIKVVLWSFYFVVFLIDPKLPQDAS